MRWSYVHLLRLEFHIFAAISFSFLTAFLKDLNGASGACVLGTVSGNIDVRLRYATRDDDVPFLNKNCIFLQPSRNLMYFSARRYTNFHNVMTLFLFLFRSRNIKYVLCLLFYALQETLTIDIN